MVVVLGISFMVEANAPDKQWGASQDLAAESYMMPMGPSAYNPFWTGMQPRMEGYMSPLFWCHALYGLWAWSLGCSIWRDLVHPGMGFNGETPIMNRQGLEAQKANLKRRREIERHRGRTSNFQRINFRGFYNAVLEEGQRNHICSISEVRRSLF